MVNISLFEILYSSIIPSVTAVIVGYAVTSITTSIVTQDFLPVIMLAAILLSIEIISLILNVIDSFLSIRTNQEIYIFVSEQITTQFIRIPLAVRESREFADKFNRVRDFGDSIAYVSSNLIEVVAVMFVTVIVSIDGSIESYSKGIIIFPFLSNNPHRLFFLANNRLLS